MDRVIAITELSSSVSEGVARLAEDGHGGVQHALIVISVTAASENKITLFFLARGD